MCVCVCLCNMCRHNDQGLYSVSDPTAVGYKLVTVDGPKPTSVEQPYPSNAAKRLKNRQPGKGTLPGEEPRYSVPNPMLKLDRQVVRELVTPMHSQVSYCSQSVGWCRCTCTFLAGYKVFVGVKG